MAARRPGGRRRGADAGEQSPGHAASGARSGSKDVSFCHLLASGCSHQARDAFQRGSPPSLGRSDIVARAPNRQGQASGHSSGSLTGVLRAPAPGARRTRPGSRGGGAGGLAGPGAPRSPSPEPGREPRLGGGGQVERFGDSRGKEDRGPRADPSAAMLGGAQPTALRGAHPDLPAGERGRHGPGRVRCNQGAQLPPRPLAAAAAGPRRVPPPRPPRAGPRPRPRPRLTCEKQTAEQRAQQDPGVPAADHGERDAACSPGARAPRGRPPLPPEPVSCRSAAAAGPMPRAPLSAAPARETATSPGNPRRPASSGRCLPAPEPAPRRCRCRCRRRGGAARSVRPARSQPPADLD